VASALTMLVVCGCRPNPVPERLFAEAEDLRLRYEKDASREAIAKYRDAAAAWASRNDLANAAQAGQRIGTTYRQLGALPESLRAFEAALSQAQASGNPLLESDVRSDLGIAASLAASRAELFDEALRQCEVALDLARPPSGLPQQAKAHTCLGEVSYNRGDRGAALGFYRRAEALWHQAGERRGEAEAILFQAGVHADRSDLDEADACYERAMALWTAIGDRRGIAITLAGQAQLLRRRGAYQEALNRFAGALALLEPMGDAVWEGSCLAGLAEVHLRLAEAPRALTYWERALDRFEGAGLTSFSADVLMSLGETHLAAGDADRALGRFEQALVLGRELGNPHWQAYALRFIGVVQLSRGQPAQAIEYITRSLDLLRPLDDPRFEAQTRADLGEAHRRLGAPARAMSAFGDGLALSRVAGDRVGQARGLFGLSQVAADLGNLEAARQNVSEALAIAESVRTEVEIRDLRASYFASVQRYHELHVDVLMRLHRAHPRRGLDAAAFEASERARARSLLDTLAEAGVDLRSEMDPALQARERQLLLAFDEWAMRQRQLPAGSAGARASSALSDEYRDLEARYAELQAEIRSKNPRLSALARPQPLGLAEVQRQVLDAGTLLLEYSLGERRSYLWAVTSTGYASHELPPRDEIEAAAQRLYQLLTARLHATSTTGDPMGHVREADARYWHEAGRLSDTLLGPVASGLAGRRLVVVADGALQYLPFAALPLPGRGGEPTPLVTEHEVVNLPSASALSVLRRQTAGRRRPAREVVVLADPVFEADDPRLRSLRRAGGPLAGQGPVVEGRLSVPRLAATRLEADAIVSQVPAGMGAKRTDFGASRTAATSPDLAEYRIVHFATHGVFDPDNPGSSGIVLSLFDERGRAQDGLLRLRDIYSLRLPADLVVLSACNTALGKRILGEGLVGAVRGFMYAGSRRVVASLWKVDDDATVEFMRRFYAAMFDQRDSPAASLRQSQLAMFREQRWRAPFYWAAFGIQGEWRQ